MAGCQRPYIWTFALGKEHLNASHLIVHLAVKHSGKRLGLVVDLVVKGLQLMADLVVLLGLCLLKAGHEAVNCSI